MRGSTIFGMRPLRFSVLVFPGVLDAGFSSLAGFAVSLYGARCLDTPVLGAFSYTSQHPSSSDESLAP